MPSALFEIYRKRHPIAKKFSLEKTNRFCEASHLVTPQEMWVGDDLSHRQDAARCKTCKNLFQRSLPVGYLPKHRDQQ